MLTLAFVGGLSAQSVRCASKKSSGSTKNKRKNTPGKFRGPKKADGDYVEAGMIMCKQLGLRYYPGENVRIFTQYIPAVEILILFSKITEFCSPLLFLISHLGVNISILSTSQCYVTSPSQLICPVFPIISALPKM